MIGLAIAAFVILAAQESGGTPRLPSEPGQISPSLPRPGAKEAADSYLRHIYAVYLAIRGCTEASADLGKPEFLPSVSLEEARRAMRQIERAAKEAGLDVNGIWADVSPVGVVTAEALKVDTPDTLDHCRRLGSVFRIDLANLQNALNALGARQPIIEKDF